MRHFHGWLENPESNKSYFIGRYGSMEQLSEDRNKRAETRALKEALKTKQIKIDVFVSSGGPLMSAIKTNTERANHHDHPIK